MTNAILKFKTLADLAAYQKEMNFDVYVINTSALTLMRIFNELEFAIAIKDYGATVLSKFDTVQ